METARLQLSALTGDNSQIPLPAPDKSQSDSVLHLAFFGEDLIKLWQVLQWHYGCLVRISLPSNASGNK